MDKLELQGRSAPLAARRLSSPLPNALSSPHPPHHGSSSSPGKRKGRQSLPSRVDQAVRCCPTGAKLGEVRAGSEKIGAEEGRIKVKLLESLTQNVVGQRELLPNESGPASPVASIEEPSEMLKPPAGEEDSADQGPERSQGARTSQDERGTADARTPFKTDGSKERTLDSADGAAPVEGPDALSGGQPSPYQQSLSEPRFSPAQESNLGTGELSAQTDPADSVEKVKMFAAPECKSVPQGSIASLTTEIETPAAATLATDLSAPDCASSPKAEASQVKGTTFSKVAESYPKEGPLRRSSSFLEKGDESRPPPRSKSLEGRRGKLAEVPGRVSSPPCSPRPNSIRTARSRSLPGSRSSSKAGHPQGLASPTSRNTPGESLVRKEPPREEATYEPCTALKSPTRSSKASALLSPKKQDPQKAGVSASANNRGSLSPAPLSPRIRIVQPIATKPRVSKRSSSIDPRVSIPGALASEKLTSQTKPQVQSLGAKTPRPKPASSPSKHPRAVLTPQPLQLASPTRHSSDPPGTLSPPGASKSPVFLRTSGALSPTGGPLSPPRTLRRSSVLSSSAESEPGASSPPTSPEGVARAERLRRATQVRLEKWRLEQEASALQAKQLEDSRREEERRRRETALELKERRRAEIYALNRKLRVGEERRVEMYRQERERRNQESGAAGSGPYAAAPVSGHHLAA